MARSIKIKSAFKLENQFKISIFVIILPVEEPEAAEAGEDSFFSSATGAASSVVAAAAGAAEEVVSSKVKSLKASTSDSSSTKMAIGYSISLINTVFVL